MGHDEGHYPCQCKERETIKTKNGFQLICKECGHGFKEVIRQNFVEEDFIDEIKEKK